MKLTLLIMAAGMLRAQEAPSGFELATTLTGAGHYSRDIATGPATAAFRAMLYPTYKINERWSASAAIQFHSTPFFREQFANPAHQVQTNVLQAQLTYARYGRKSSLVWRTGQLSSAFGAFLLRYDDAANPLPDMPLAYGYYYKSVTSLGLPGTQVDVTAGNFDARAQFANSSPSNRRTLAQSDQYGSYTAGGGYTIVQGFRVGASFHRGAYLHREHRFYFPGEARPRDLPATGIGLDAQLGRGPWNFYGEWQYHHRAYRAIPTFTQKTGYAELRRVLNARWYAAFRMDYERASAYPGREVFDAGIGFRPNRHQLVKVAYAFGPASGNTLSLQLVTSLRPISVARH